MLSAPGQNDICFLPVPELGRRLRSGDLTAAKLTDAFFRRIAAYDGHLKSYARLMEASARADAASADIERAAGIDRGPLHGIPVALKDLVDTKGVVSAGGMALHAHRVPAEDATIVRRLRAAGAVVLGKLAMTEGAMIAHHPSIAAPRNPWRAGHDSGFSSSGSGVAVAAGLCAVASGSDTGGSIRIPAAFNGVTGLKPTWGRVSRHGVHPLVQHLDTVGPMARSASGAAAMLGVIAGADPRDPTAEHAPVPRYLAAIEAGVRGLKIGVDWPRIKADCDPAVVDALHHAAAILALHGAQLSAAALPPIDLMRIVPSFAAGAAASHQSSYPECADSYGRESRALLDAGLAATGPEVATAIDVARAFAAGLRSLFADVDLILVPALGFAAPPVGTLIELAETEADFVQRRWAYTLPFNVSGSPTITFPAGFAEGLPVAAQLVGAHFSEDLLFRAVHAFQGSTDWHLREPSCR